MESIDCVNESVNIFNEDIAFVEQYNFSQANLNESNRILAITQVASVCYQSSKALGSESLYNRLMAESMGLPSSSFEFVPVLLNPRNDKHKEVLALEYCNAKKYGEVVEDNLLLTNYRALVYDYEKNPSAYSFDIRTILNTEEECAIIKKHFKVFYSKLTYQHAVKW